MQKLSLLFVALTLSAAQPPAPSPVPLQHPVQDKNFYILSLIEQSPAAKSAIKSDPTLSKLAETKRIALTESVKTCPADPACYAKALKWTNEEIDQAKHALSSLKFSIDTPLRRSGMYIRYHGKSPEALLMQAWIDA